MKSKKADNTQTILLGAIILLVILSAGIQTGTLKLGEFYGSAGEGFTVISVSATNTISNDADLNSAKFTVTAAATGAGQSLVGRFDDEIVDKYANLVIKHPLEITAGAVQETLTYPIRNDGESGTIYKYELKSEPRKDTWTGASCNIGRQDFITCIAVIDVVSIDGIFGDDTVYKIFKTKAGKTGTLDNPNVDFSIPVTIKANGIPYTQTIQSRGTPESAGTSEARFTTATGAWLANVQWSGSMVTGQANPTPTLYKATYIDGALKWNIASSSTYETYKQTTGLAATNPQFVQKLNDVKEACGAWFSWEPVVTRQARCNAAIDLVQSDINNQRRTADNLLTENVQITYGASTTDVFTTVGTPYNADGTGSVIQKSTRKITIPVLTFTIKASEIAIFSPVGVPEIISITIPSFASGDATGLATLHVKNAGTGTGTFRATFSDPTGTFTHSGNTLGSQIQLVKGAEGDILVYIGHEANAVEAVKTLTFRVTDVNSGKYVEKTADASMTKPKDCTPNTTKQEGKAVLQCKADGTGYVVILDCTAGGKVVDYIAGVPTCIVGVGDDTNNGDADGDGAAITKTVQGKYVTWYNTPQAALLLILIAALIIVAWRKKNEQ